MLTAADAALGGADGSAGADVVKTSGGSVDGAAPGEAVVRDVSRVLTAADAAALSCCDGGGGVSVSKVLTAAGAAVQPEVPHSSQ